MDSICDCCGFIRATLPYHHDAHDDSGDSWDYCQDCFDAGCDLRSCSFANTTALAPAVVGLAQSPHVPPHSPNPPQTLSFPMLANANVAPPQPVATVPSTPVNLLTPEDLMKALSGDGEADPKDQKEEKPKPPPVVLSHLIDASGTEAVIADVSTFDDSEPRLEVHKLSPLVQDGRRRVLDGSSTQGLSITQCGINQESRSHGWFIVNNENQEKRITRGEVPVCPKCFANDEL